MLSCLSPDVKRRASWPRWHGHTWKRCRQAGRVGLAVCGPVQMINYCDGHGRAWLWSSTHVHAYTHTLDTYYVDADRHGLRLTPSRRRLLAGVLTEARRGPAAISSPTAGPESRGGGEAWLGSDCGQAVVKQRPFAICHSAVGGRWTVDGARLRSNKRVERLRPSLRACTPPVLKRARCRCRPDVMSLFFLLRRFFPCPRTALVCAALHRSPTDRDHEDDAEHVHGCCPTRSSGAVAVPG